MRVYFTLAAGCLMACSSQSDKSSNSPANTPSAMPLAGSEWNMGNGSEAFVAFKVDGSVIGSGGCNNFRGTYTQEGSKIKIGPLASTKKLCPPAIMSIEDKLLSALDDTASVDASHLSLTLMDADGEIILMLRRSDWD